MLFLEIRIALVSGDLKDMIQIENAFSKDYFLKVFFQCPEILNEHFQAY